MLSPKFLLLPFFFQDFDYLHQGMHNTRIRGKSDCKSIKARSSLIQVLCIMIAICPASSFIIPSSKNERFLLASKDP